MYSVFISLCVLRADIPMYSVLTSQCTPCSHPNVLHAHIPMYSVLTSQCTPSHPNVLNAHIHKAPLPMTQLRQRLHSQTTAPETALRLSSCISLSRQPRPMNRHCNCALFRKSSSQLRHHSWCNLCCLGEVSLSGYSNLPLLGTPTPLLGTPTPLSCVLQPPSPGYSNPSLLGTPTPLSQVL